MTNSQLGDFLDEVESRLKLLIPESKVDRIMQALFPVILRAGHDDDHSPDEDDDYETLAWGFMYLLESIAELKGMEAIFKEPDHK